MPAEAHKTMGLNSKFIRIRAGWLHEFQLNLGNT